MKNEKICLIGCGWLGKPLAQHLILAQYQVTATTAHDKSGEFKAAAIAYLPFDLSLESALPGPVTKANILIYTIPPLNFSIVKSFFDKVDVDKKIIFTSSTSIFGKNLGDVDESFAADLTNTSSPLLLQTEEYLRLRFKNLTIIRPGGLYGDKRHPVFFLQGKKNLTTGAELLHLVHREDCINAITAVIENDIWNETFNLVSDLRVLKKDYYIEMAKKMNLTPPEYDDMGLSSGQTNISNNKSKRLLQITYRNPNQH
ncbi:MAG: hypothetical protein H7336_07015 [Bacteriovorax sp.]|nr:hypothetical protein [Bacteriovorax sp.]